MKHFNIFLVFFFVFVSCKAQDPQAITDDQKDASGGFSSYGTEINADATLDTANMTEKYQTLKVSDTLQLKFAATVTEVCQSKGCWMKLQLKDGQQAMVRFKDYGFFMPMNIKGKEVIVNGLAFVSEMSVEDQRHYAKDAGKPDDEIEKIVNPKKTFGFEADGVLLKN